MTPVIVAKIVDIDTGKILMPEKTYDMTRLSDTREDSYFDIFKWTTTLEYTRLESKKIGVREEF